MAVYGGVRFLVLVVAAVLGLQALSPATWMLKNGDNLLAGPAQVSLAWGSNGVGQVGDGTTTMRLSPVQVSGLSGVSMVAAGAYHSVVLRTNGSVWGWGWGVYGQLDAGSTADRYVPTQMAASSGAFIAIGAGDEYTLAVLDSP